MKTDQFTEALNALPAADQVSVQGWLDSWVAIGGELRQVAANFMNEAHLPASAFAAVLLKCAQTFSARVVQVMKDVECDLYAICGEFARKGPEMDPTLRPASLGRVVALDVFVRPPPPDSLDAPDEADRSKLQQELYARYGKPLRVSCLCSSSHPGRVAWGTFSVRAGDSVFKPPLDVLDNAVIALGLEHYKTLPPSHLLQLHYDTPLGEPLLVPTVGDAGAFSCFRPAPRCDDGSPAPHGWTKPLEDRAGIDPQPEVVHRYCTWGLPV